MYKIHSITTPTHGSNTFQKNAPEPHEKNEMKTEKGREGVCERARECEREREKITNK